jgi:translation initiation factor IF-2
MAEEKMMRLSQVARQLNVGAATIQAVLGAKGYKVENSPNAKISSEQFDILAKSSRRQPWTKRRLRVLPSVKSTRTTFRTISLLLPRKKRRTTFSSGPQR